MSSRRCTTRCAATIAEVLLLGLDGQVRLRSRTFKSLSGLAWTPQSEVWFTASDGPAAGTLRELAEDGDDRVVATAPGRLVLHDIAGDGRVLLAREQARVRLKVSPPGVRGERELSWFDASALADLSADGTQVLFYESGEAAGERYRTYLRPADGSPAVLLGEGVGAAISPDNRWALIGAIDDPAKLELVPTGAGKPRELDRGSLVERVTPGFLPDGRVIYTGREPGGPPRIYVQAPDGPPQPVGAPGLHLVGGSRLVTPDGRYAAALRDGVEVVLAPLDGGAPVKVAGIEPHESLAGFTDDGAALVYTTIGFPCRVSRLDPKTGQRGKVYDIELPEWETAGVIGITRMAITADAKGYAYSLISSWGELYVASDVD